MQLLVLWHVSSCSHACLGEYSTGSYVCIIQIDVLDSDLLIFYFLYGILVYNFFIAVHEEIVPRCLMLL